MNKKSLFLSIIIVLQIFNYGFSLRMNQSKTTYTINQEELKFAQFKINFNKIYASAEDPMRFQIYKENLLKLEKLQKVTNAFDPNTNVVFGETIFFDMSAEEFLARSTGLIIDDQFRAILSKTTVKSTRSKSNVEIAENSITTSLGEPLNWVTMEKVTEIKDQKNCGSCWAFAINAVLESASLIKYGKYINLSEQHLVDCASGDYISGCNGASPYYALDWIKKNGGLTLENYYPYSGLKETCTVNESPLVINVESFNYLYMGQVSQIITLLRKGVLQIVVNSLGPIQFYKGGILSVPKTECDPKNLNHAVNLVGFGIETLSGEPYWIIRNSWGTEWGEKGYIRIAARDRFDQSNIAGVCGCNSLVIYAFID